MSTLEGFAHFWFTHDGATRKVFRAGRGPGVVIMHEIPGITPEVARFARRVVDDGFSVFLPQLFGEVGRGNGVPYSPAQMVRACISREFSLLAAREASPVTEWLRALCRHAHVELGGKGVGAIGMCLTGNFALALMVDPSVMAPVLSQPSLPLPVDRERRAALHVSDRDLAEVKRRVAEEGACVLGLRFKRDPLVPAERFETLRRELGAGFECIEIDNARGNPHGIPIYAHSVVTSHLVDEAGHPTRAALERVLGFFHERLD